MTVLTVVEGDICNFDADVVVFKHAQSFYGADAVAAGTLASVAEAEQLSPEEGQHVAIDTQLQMPAHHALFVGVVPLFMFDYAEIRKFSDRALRIISAELPDSSHVAMTIHGVGYGLDEREAFLSQVGGILDAANSSIERVTIVERSSRRAQRLRRLLREATSDVQAVIRPESQGATKSHIDAGIESDSKGHVFVAMPFAGEFEDTFVFGIQNPINAVGLLCERVDMAVFTGDILDRVKSRIETAALVVADLTGSNANVFLEVGYAWGRDRPTLLISRADHELPFDVRGQRCIKYKNIVDLSKQLSRDLAALDVADT